MVINLDRNLINNFLVGWFYGFGYFLSNLYWISNSLKFDENFKNLIFLSILLKFFNIKMNFISILIFSLTLSIIEYVRGTIFGGFPWNLISFSFVSYLEFIQLLSITGTYAFNSIIILLFLLPTVLFFSNKKKIKIIIFSFSLLMIFTNYFWGSSNLKNY